MKCLVRTLTSLMVLTEYYDPKEGLRVGSMSDPSTSVETGNKQLASPVYKKQIHLKADNEQETADVGLQSLLIFLEFYSDSQSE